MSLYSRKAQSISEYAVFLAMAAAVLLGMQVYVIRGLQGRLRDASNHITSTMNQTLEASYPNQFEPDYRNTTRDINEDVTLTAELSSGKTNREARGRIRTDFQEVIIR